MASSHVPLLREADPQQRVQRKRQRGEADEPTLSAVSPLNEYHAAATVHLWPCFCANCCASADCPLTLRTQVDAEGIIYLAEYLPVTRRFSGSVPGKRANTNISSYVGSLVITPQRVLGTLSSVPKLAGRTIDQRWDAPQSGPVKADISDTGLHIEVDIGEVDPKFNGHLSLNYKTPIPDDVLMRLPRRSLAFEVPPEYVLRAVGVPDRA